MTEYLIIKIDKEAYNVALAILHQEFAFMRNNMTEHPKQAKLERAIGAFYAASLINPVNNREHRKEVEK